MYNSSNRILPSFSSPSKPVLLNLGVVLVLFIRYLHYNITEAKLQLGGKEIILCLGVTTHAKLYCELSALGRLRTCVRSIVCNVVFRLSIACSVI